MRWHVKQLPRRPTLNAEFFALHRNATEMILDEGGDDVEVLVATYFVRSSASARNAANWAEPASDATAPSRRSEPMTRTVLKRRLATRCHVKRGSEGRSQAANGEAEHCRVDSSCATAIELGDRRMREDRSYESSNHRRAWKRRASPSKPE